MNYDQPSYNEGRERVVQTQDYNPAVTAMSDAALLAEIYRRRLDEYKLIIDQQAQKIKDIQTEKEDAIAKANAERDEAIAKMNIYKGQAEFAQNTIIGIATNSNSSDAKKKDTCDLINDYFNGVLPINKGGKPRASTPKTLETFIINIDDIDCRNKTLIKAFKDCKKYKLIAEDTVEKDFIDIFTGVRTEAKIKWLAGPGALSFLFKQLKQKETIKIPKGFGIWEVVKSHFVDKNGKDFDQVLSSQKPPQKKDVVANIMDIVSTMELGY